MKKNDWSGRRVFVTGHTGFKGTWLCASLIAAGAQVSGYALPPSTDPNMHDLVGLSGEIESTLGDVRDAEGVEKALVRARPDIVFHLAAQPIVRLSLEDPVGTIGTNVMGTVHVLDAIRRVPSVRAAVIVTSDKCYENVGWLWPYRESEPMGGHDPYSSSKGAAELMVSAYRRTYFGNGPAVASARAGNVIGGGDWSPSRLIPDIVRALVADRAPSLRFPGATRPWQHVLDAISGYQLLGHRLLEDGAQFADAWNFGPDERSACTVLEMANLFLGNWQTHHTCVVESEIAPHEAAVLRLDSSRAHKLLGWSSAHDLEAAVAATAGWYHAWHDGDDMRAVTLADVHEMWATRESKQLVRT
jgi:CDP-glucose 4,6-dehydratase